MVTNPKFTWHFKQRLSRDVAATATSITDEDERRAVFKRMRELEDRMGHVDVDDLAKRSPMVEVEFTSL